ncbi:MAG: DUF120 domain-containing protein [Desulfurococcaceae archaeon]
MCGVLRGKVFSGTGEGAHYVKLYNEQLSRILSSCPYPGTLNVLLDRCFYELVDRSKLVVIPPPKPGLGAAYACPGYLMGIPVLLVKPAVTMYWCEVVEVISHINLRKELKLKDGDVVEIVLVN